MGLKSPDEYPWTLSNNGKNCRDPLPHFGQREARVLEKSEARGGWVGLAGGAFSLLCPGFDASALFQLSESFIFAGGALPLL